MNTRGADAMAITVILAGPCDRLGKRATTDMREHDSAFYVV
jgi:hypothetical protein